MHELAAKDVPNERKLIPKPEALDFIASRISNLSANWWRKRPSTDGFLLHHRKIYRLLPRSSHPFNWTH